MYSRGTLLFSLTHRGIYHVHASPICTSAFVLPIPGPSHAEVYQCATRNGRVTPSRMHMSSSTGPQPNSLLSLRSLTTTFHVMRHGQSEANVQKIISSDPSISTMEHGLTDLGRQAAADESGKFAEQLEDGVNIAVFSSDFKRARETAEILCGCLSQKGLEVYGGGVIFDTRLRERWFGSLNGGPDTEYGNVWKHDAVNPDHNEFEAESVNSVVRRTSDFVLELEKNFGEVPFLSFGDPKKWECVLVAHGDVLQILQTAFNKVDGTNHRNLEHLETATIRRLELKK
mmetsp:Transcript_20303/g.40528  ORF Transcript_20303/g.40528 Transcript_20303/m.40528 type:complete len:286 (-) Transcript_20303:29-886(-)